MTDVKFIEVFDRPFADLNLNILYRHSFIVEDNMSTSRNLLLYIVIGLLCV